MSCEGSGGDAFRKCEICAEPGHVVNGSTRLGRLCQRHRRVAECARIVLAEPDGREVIDWVAANE